MASITAEQAVLADDEHRKLIQDARNCLIKILPNCATKLNIDIQDQLNIILEKFNIDPILDDEDLDGLGGLFKATIDDIMGGENDDETSAVDGNMKEENDKVHELNSISSVYNLVGDTRVSSSPTSLTSQEHKSSNTNKQIPKQRGVRLQRRKISFKYESLPSEIGTAKNTLRQVIIFTRHGTRLPLHNFPNDKSWPCDQKFWEAYSGILSPVGHAEMHALGILLRKRYVDEYKLFKGVNLCEHVEVHSTNSVRTLQSAANFCMGLFPGLPIYYTVVSDRLGAGKTTEDLIHEDRSTNGICLAIDTLSDNLLRQAKSSESFSIWKKKRQEDPWLKNKCKERGILELLDKLWKLSGYPKLNPEKNTPPQRLRKMCVIYTQLKIAERHNLQPFLNDDGIALTKEDVETIAEVARHVWATKYNRHSPLERSSGRAAAGYVVHEISRNMIEMVDEIKRLGKKHTIAATGNDNNNNDNNSKDDDKHPPHPPPKMVVYSAHDGTILSLLARFGIDKMKEAEFGGNIIFELHEKVPGNFSVEFRYNNDPNKFGESKKLPVTEVDIDKYNVYSDMENGDVQFEEFTNFYTLEKLGESQQAFLDLHMLIKRLSPKLRASKFRRMVHDKFVRKGIRKRKTSVAKVLGGAYAIEVWKKHEVVPMLRDAFKRAADEGIPWEKQFRALDADGNGYVTFEELDKLLVSQLQVNANREALRDFIELFDANDDGNITVTEFITFINEFIVLNEDNE